jgi:prepilin-type processing-associated H-X9-DG protein
MRSPPRTAAFTLLELLVVLAGLSLFCLLLRPALAGGRPNVQVLQCMNNFRQITMGWQAYVADNNERLIPGARPVGGMLDWSANQDNTNAGMLMDPIQSPLAAYVKSPGLWKCPADQLQSPANPGPRVRSYSMNSALGGNPTIYNQYPADRTYFAARSFSDLNRPGPALTFVLIDEHPDSINDSVFHVMPGLPPTSAAWRDLPAGFHNSGAVMSFADGHALLHKWEDPRTLLPPKMQAKWWPTPAGSYVVRGSADYLWINDRMPYR